MRFKLFKLHSSFIWAFAALSFSVLFGLFYLPFGLGPLFSFAAGSNDGLSGSLSSSLLSISKGKGTYSLHSPILISKSPMVRITRGTVEFSLHNSKSDKNTHSGLLPSSWTDIFIKQKLSNINLSNATIFIDFRTPPHRTKNKSSKNRVKTDPSEIMVGDALRSSGLDFFALQNSTVTLLRDFSKPAIVTIKKGRFDIDLKNSEIEGAGEMLVQGEKTSFTIEHDFSKRNDKNFLLNQINLSMSNKVFSSSFEGVIEGRNGVHLSGNAMLDVSDTKVFNRWFDDLLFQKKDQINKQTTNIKFSAKGALNWSGLQGTLSKGQFKFENNEASGSLSLKISPDNPEISGTLAFKDLDLSSFNLYSSELKKSEKTPGSLINQRVSETSKVIYSLIHSFDADLRISAKSISLNKFKVQDTGFSLFQKKGELIVDMAGVDLFDGQATGLLKIDTKFPKPRWHINADFNKIELATFSKALHTPLPFSGAGDLKIHITSFGDKSSEIYENMYGAILFSMPNNGKISLNLPGLLGEQIDSSEIELKKLKKGSTNFLSLHSTGHFAKGAIVTDHFLIKTKNNDFTGNGYFNFKNLSTNWHIGSWDSIRDGVVRPEDETNPEQNEIIEGLAPLLLTCSQISGNWDSLNLQKHTALHLSLLKRGCPAVYQYKPLKTKDHPIVPTDDAG